jgi:hypothetical protein
MKMILAQWTHLTQHRNAGQSPRESALPKIPKNRYYCSSEFTDRTQAINLSLSWRLPAFDPTQGASEG